MESLGIELPTFGKVIVALVVVVGLLGGVMWALRRFGAERFGGAAARGRQPRLAVIDAAAVDGRRRLVLIRRDNVEHLLMIGGPTDVVVEPNIVRAMGAPRDVPRDVPRETPPARGTPISDSLTRPVPLGEGTMWPLQPQPETMSRPSRAIAEEPVEWSTQAQPEPAPHPQRPPETLAGLAEELSGRPFTQHDFSLSSGRASTPETSRAAPPQPTPPLTPPQAPANGDQNLAEMAHRLEAALRGPSESRRGAEDSPKPEVKLSMPEPKPARPEVKPAQPKTMYDSLEQEMASLLGRPSGKT
jgi:hypothetical protein